MFYASWVYSVAMVLSFVVLNSSLISSIVLNLCLFKKKLCLFHLYLI